MKILFALVSAVFLYPVSASAQTYCDDFGNCSGGGARLYSDERTGSIRGQIDGERVDLQENRLGGMSGSIGDERVQLYDNRLGGVSGSIGDQRVQMYENRSGGMSGSIGGEPVTCHDTPLGMKCY